MQWREKFLHIHALDDVARPQRAPGFLQRRRRLQMSAAGGDRGNQYAHNNQWLQQKFLMLSAANSAQFLRPREAQNAARGSLLLFLGTKRKLKRQIRLENARPRKGVTRREQQMMVLAEIINGAEIEIRVRAAPNRLRRLAI